MSAQKRAGDVSIPDSAIHTKPETFHAGRHEITAMPTPSKNDHDTTCLEVEQHEQTFALHLPEEQGSALRQSTDSSCLESSVEDYLSASSSSDDDGPCSGYSGYTSSLTQPKMYSPGAAKEMSAMRPGIFFEITTKDPQDRIEEEDDCADGMVLRGFLNGLPLYYHFSRYVSTNLTAVTTPFHCV